ncbi:type II toxin-antitoxin system HicA family toxin [Luteolibacter sp. SL250]|uniref:type II toxin-antitoxin system HicA family toxin n=1 Tax=Luteolibacter sp. SL250 TaxID=2995170 RepID=UPI0022721A7B|nr:type II toxin-antitoxin system HicA family toxin [Luteolibacter sp. SL250]WAC18530.1 type II toxin-antitoxin system HicA family toxin [Luteolibacter sp. SL250]
MKSVSGKHLAKLAEERGWRLARINGSHHVYVMDGRMERLVIPIHGNQDLKIGLLRSLMKLVSLTEEEL